MNYLFICLTMIGLFFAKEKTIIVDSNIDIHQAIEGTLAPSSVTDNLILIDVEYYSFDKNLHRGQIVVHKDLEADIKAIFNKIKELHFPVGSVIPIKFDRPDGKTSMDTLNNSYSFHYRQMTTSTKRSFHSMGTAIDINPFHNPAILSSGKIIPTGGRYEIGVDGTLTADSEIVRYVESLGWTWGGRWNSIKDYMHFEKAIR